MTKKNTWAQRGKPISVRFAEKIMPVASGCHEWQSAIGSRGYGVFWVSRERRTVFAHRYALELALGHELPENKLVMHSCDNPRCVNPDHLSLGTSSDNLLDASNKGRIARGERNGGGGKLKESQVKEIFESKGENSCRVAAIKYGVSSQTIKAIRGGKIWRHVTGKSANV